MISRFHEYASYDCHPDTAAADRIASDAPPDRRSLPFDTVA
jgi:hypothetical protein